MIETVLDIFCKEKQETYSQQVPFQENGKQTPDTEQLLIDHLLIKLELE